MNIIKYDIYLTKTKMIKPNALILSSDSLPNYGLDLIFSTIKEAGLDGIDLAMWKWFDAWNEDYVKKLSFQYDLPVYVIQTSAKLNQKEMNKALDLCEATGSTTICINAPRITEFKASSFIKDNLPEYQKQNPGLNFSIINPTNSNFFALPIPEFHFSNVNDIVKKYEAYLGLDIANIDIENFEEDFIRKIEEYSPYISVLYFSDKDKKGHNHLLPGDWDLNLTGFLKKLRKIWYARPVSIKIDFSNQELSNRDKIIEQLVKIREFYEKHFLNEKVDPQGDNNFEDEE